MRDPSASRIFAKEFLEALGVSRGGGGGPGFVVAFVGAGGKTSALFAAAEGALPLRVIATTTTHIRDPRRESGRNFDAVLISSPLSGPRDAGKSVLPPGITPRAGRGPLVVASGEIEDGRLSGVHPSRAAELRSACDLLLVEADGARGLSVKALSPTEPVIPSCADVVVGVIGMDCVGKPMDGRFVHRPEFFGPLTGCDQGHPILPEHLARLVVSPEGLFKGAPTGALRVVLLNKTDAAPSETTEAVRTALEAVLDPKTPSGFGLSRILACSLRDGVWAGKKRWSAIAGVY